MALALALALALAASIVGCSSELEVWPGKHLDYLSSPSLTACRGTHSYVDSFVPFFPGELGVANPSGLEYRWLDRDDFDDAPCRGSISGCARNGTAYARSPAMLHEVVHTVTETAGMNRHLFFTEGVAAAYDPWLGDGVGPRYTLAVAPGEPLPDPRLELDASKDDLDYALAGSFVTFLLTRHGPSKFVDFSRQVGESSDLGSIRSTFSMVYETDFDVEVDLFRSGTPCVRPAFSVRVYDCVSPKVDWVNDSWSLDAEMNCDDDAVVGDGTDPRSPIVRSATLEVPSTGQYTLSVEGAEGVVVQAGPCFGCPWIPGEVGVSAGGEVTAELAAGLYYMRIRAQAADAGDVRVTLHSAP